MVTTVHLQVCTSIKTQIHTEIQSHNIKINKSIDPEPFISLSALFYAVDNALSQYGYTQDTV